MHWVMLLLVVTSSFLGLTCRGYFLQDTVQDYLGLIEDFATRLKKLSLEGMNTSEAEKFIKNALLLLGKEDLTEEEIAWIQSNLTAADQEIRRLESEFQSYMFWKTAWVVAKVILLLSIPVITYVFLPRLWAYVWFKSRRKWIVRKRETDKCFNIKTSQPIILSIDYLRLIHACFGEGDDYLRRETQV